MLNFDNLNTDMNLEQSSSRDKDREAASLSNPTTTTAPTTRQRDWARSFEQVVTTDELKDSLDQLNGEKITAVARPPLALRNRNNHIVNGSHDKGRHDNNAVDSRNTSMMRPQQPVSRSSKGPDDRAPSGR
jgi:hypothetical protein